MTFGVKGWSCFFLCGVLTVILSCDDNYSLYFLCVAKVQVIVVVPF